MYWMPRFIRHRIDPVKSVEVVIHEENGRYFISGKTGRAVYSTDDGYEAFVEAIKMGNTIKVIGTIEVDRTIEITKSNVKIVGDNRLASKVKLTSTDDIPLFKIGDGSNYIQHVRIEGLHLQGTTKDAGSAIHDNGCNACEYVANLIDTFKYGIYLNGTSSQHAREALVAFNDIGGVGYGIRAETYSNGLRILGNYIYNTENDGISLAGSIENTIAENHLPYGVGGTGIYGYNSNRNLVIGNHLYGVGGHGIQFGGGSERNHIVGNYVQGPSVSNPGGYDGIRLFDTATQNEIVANYINGLGRTRYGVNTGDSTGGANYVAHNVIFGTTSSRYNINEDSDFCDQCIYTSLPSSPAMPGLKIIYYDGTYYYVAVWNGSAWVKVQLS